MSDSAFICPYCRNELFEGEQSECCGERGHGVYEDELERSDAEQERKIKAGFWSRADENELALQAAMAAGEEDG